MQVDHAGAMLQIYLISTMIAKRACRLNEYRRPYRRPHKSWPTEERHTTYIATDTSHQQTYASSSTSLSSTSLNASLRLLSSSISRYVAQLNNKNAAMIKHPPPIAAPLSGLFSGGGNS